MSDPKWDAVAGMIENLRSQACEAMAKKTTLVSTLEPKQAFLLADALQHWMDCKMPLYREIAELEDRVTRAAQTADEMMHDTVMRIALATADLELLLENFIGRPPATLADIRKARTERGTVIARDARPRIRVSDELRKSIVTGRIGIPRDPGQEG